MSSLVRGYPIAIQPIDCSQYQPPAIPQTLIRRSRSSLLLLLVILFLTLNSVCATTSKPSKVATNAAASSTKPSSTQPIPPPSTAAVESESISDELPSHDLFDEDEFEGVPKPSLNSPSEPAIAIADISFTTTLLSFFGMNSAPLTWTAPKSSLSSSTSSSTTSSSSSSFFSDHWLSLSVGTVLCAGAAILAYLRPWAHSGANRRGKKKKAPEEDPQFQPLLVELKSKRGKVQGSNWVEKNLRKDDDGDEAHEFLGPF